MHPPSHPALDRLRQGAGPNRPRDDRWDRLGQHLQALAKRGNRLVYVPNEGNAGDALIASGTWQFFEDYQLHPLPRARSRLRAGDTAIYAGGGNLVPEYRRCADFLQTCLDRDVGAIVVMPHTIRGHAALLAKLDQRVTLVCRDAPSLAYVMHAAAHAQVLAAPDMALRLDVPRLIARCAQRAVRAAVLGDLGWQCKLVAYWRWRQHLLRLAHEADKPVMAVMRADAEAPAGANSDPSLDVPNFYGSKFRTRSEADMVSRDLIALMQRSRRVVTNRLHVGIAAALTGVPVTYHDNSYGKIRAVYDCSMQSMPNVSFAVGG